MAIKKRHTIAVVDNAAAAKLNENFDQVYSHRIESRWKRDVSAASAADRTNTFAVTAYTYQSMEHGESLFSANNSQNVCQTFSLKENHETIVYANAHARSNGVTAHVVSLTSNSNGWDISIEVRPISASFVSMVTTNQITVYYQVIGAPVNAR